MTEYRQFISRAAKALFPGFWLVRKFDQSIHGGRATYIGNNRVLTKATVGNRDFAFIVEADDKLIAPLFIVTGKYDTGTTNYLLRNLRPDSHCLDVGANFGYFTCLMARLCSDGKVIGIEADPKIAEIARDNVVINGLHEIAAIMNAAASDSAGEVTLYRRGSRSGNTSIIHFGTEFTDLMREPPEEPFSVSGVRIDDLHDAMGGRVDFIKLDVEGAEPLALAGARATIEHNQQLQILMEWSPGQIQAAGFEIGAFLKEIEATQLRPFEINRRWPRSISFDDLANLPYRSNILLKRP
jgi:FkbM family methyltransferase